MNVLAITNSFGVDANRYLHQLAEAAGENLNVATLYIPSCSLEMHYRNMLGDKPDYDLHFNGVYTGFKVSIEQALLARKWDVVTLQQASYFSPKADSYFPYAEELYDYIKTCQPKAQVWMHQTWAYDDGSKNLQGVGYPTFDAMFADIKNAYLHCHSTLGTDGIIPCGELLQKLRDRCGMSVHRDGLHVTLGLGRYALGLLWLRMLTGITVADNTFSYFDQPISAEHIAIAKELVDGFEPSDYRK